MRRVVVFTLLLIFIGQTQALPDGIDSRGDDGCLCHGGSDDTTIITLEGLPEKYNASTSYNFTLTIESPVQQTNPQGGFRILLSHGEIIGDGWQFQDGGYTHRGEINDRRQWSAVWTAPSEDDLLTTFVVHGNAVDGDNSMNGDEWNSFSTAIPGQNYDGEVTSPGLMGSVSTLQIGIAALSILIFIALVVRAYGDFS